MEVPETRTPRPRIGFCRRAGTGLDRQRCGMLARIGVGPEDDEELREKKREDGSSGHRARLGDDDRRLLRASCSVAVEVLVQFAPALPQLFTLLADRSSAEHLAPDPTGQLDDRLRMGLRACATSPERPRRVGRHRLRRCTRAGRS
jgi:hypothetical protein